TYIIGNRMFCGNKLAMERLILVTESCRSSFTAPTYPDFRLWIQCIECQNMVTRLYTRSNQQDFTRRFLQEGTDCKHRNSGRSPSSHFRAVKQADGLAGFRVAHSYRAVDGRQLPLLVCGLYSHELVNPDIVR